MKKTRCYWQFCAVDEAASALLSKSPQTPLSESSFSDSAFYQQNRVRNFAYWSIGVIKGFNEMFGINAWLQGFDKGAFSGKIAY